MEKSKKKAALENLSKLQYEVTQKNATERPFENEFWNNHLQGLYVDIVSKEPLFTSLDKFDSNCGWPSFTKSINDISTIVDKSYGMTRIEVRSKEADSHLGHLFDDGPEELGGMRYCINSASLEFIPYDQLELRGYGKYMKLFKERKDV